MKIGEALSFVVTAYVTSMPRPQAHSSR